MSIVDDLVANLVERNGIRLSGTLAIRLIAGGVSINGTLKSTLRDQKKNPPRDLLNVNIPVDARVKIDDIVIPLPNIP